MSTADVVQGFQSAQQGHAYRRRIPRSGRLPNGTIFADFSAFEPPGRVTLPEKITRSRAYIAPEGRPDQVAPFERAAEIPDGYVAVPGETSLRTAQREGLKTFDHARSFAAPSASGSLSALQQLQFVAKGRTARPKRKEKRKKFRKGTSHRKGAMRRGPRPPRPPRPRRPPRAPRPPRTPREPRDARPPRAKGTKNAQVPGICRVQCGGTSGSCWNTGVCISGYVPYPDKIGSCCFPRITQCAL
jgi:hypothetical protein